MMNRCCKKTQHIVWAALFCWGVLSLLTGAAVGDTVTNANTLVTVLSILQGMPEGAWLAATAAALLCMVVPWLVVGYVIFQLVEYQRKLNEMNDIVKQLLDRLD